MAKAFPLLTVGRAISHALEEGVDKDAVIAGGTVEICDALLPSFFIHETPVQGFFPHLLHHGRESFACKAVHQGWATGVHVDHARRNVDPGIASLGEQGKELSPDEGIATHLGL